MKGLNRMQEGLKVQMNAEKFDVMEKCRKLCRLKKMLEVVRVHMNAGRFEGSARCREI